MLITAARNEAGLIERTIQSVVAQTHQPLRWVIVSDGSTDGTDEIVQRHAAAHPWIELLRMPESQERNFAGKARAFNAGWDKLKPLPCDFVGNLDADVFFGADFFAYLVEKLAADPALGLAGAAFVEAGRTYNYRFVGLDHVSGQCQLFRRQCLEDIGGYEPIKSGGIDLTAELTARFKGWRTRTFAEKVFTHLRQMGTANNSGLKLHYKLGVENYLRGSHPVWAFFQASYHMLRKPLLVGGLLMLAGYFKPALLCRPKTLAPALVEIRRRDQMDRLKRILRLKKVGQPVDSHLNCPCGPASQCGPMGMQVAGSKD